MPMSCNKIVRTTVAAGFIAAGAMLVACGDDEEPGVQDTTTMTTPDLTTTTTATATTTPGQDEDVVTPAAAQQLCDMIEPELDNWRDQGATLAKVSFNGTVQNWAARNDGLNDEVIGDTTIVDEATTNTCPDIRQQALEVLEVQNLSDALVGFGN
ncbi:hypothetical protein [Nocardia otitidiscaviarum]|uniref:hypothetical protein n=1 Tax=Nocardia otitidiscaviarum TaxID=1823 RepID=UPI002453F30C|nr:hypothetical protein [Nocardia otitidiscaviarum]